MTYSESTKEAKGNNLKFVLSKTGLIGYDKDMPCTIRFDRKETDEIVKRSLDYTKYDHFCEVAHLEISSKCNMDCKYCYVSGKGQHEGLSTDQWKRIIDNLASARVFQVSFGGGEPTMRPDLFDLAKHVNRTGMNLGMTTNGTLLKRLNVENLKAYFKQINISWHSNPEVVDEALEFLYDNNIKAGINYCFSRQMAKENDVVKALSEYYGAEILYLVYKPVINDIKNQVPAEEVYKIAKEAANEGLKVAVDGPCVNRCMAKKKFIDVDCNGNVYPCSFIRKPLGNLLEQKFVDVWKNRGEQETCPYVDIKQEDTSGEE